MKIEAITLTSAIEFDRLFFELLQKKICKTHLEAFEHLNSIYFDATGIQRYSSYDSYRICRNIRTKKKA